ncbi:hypothetical protein SAMN05216428_104174 [Nitrosospira sp. Nsp11]|nr:hypothetical protein SAMN05216428_104174 [Nitrosospira sp. Nsp11]
MINATLAMPLAHLFLNPGIAPAPVPPAGVRPNEAVIFLLLCYGYKERYHWIAFLTIRSTLAASQVWYIRGVSQVWLLNAKHVYSFSAIFYKEISHEPISHCHSDRQPSP